MSKDIEGKVRYLYKHSPVKEIEKMEAKQFYSTILISSQDQVDIKNYKMIIKSIGKICKVNWLGFREGKHLELGGRLKEWGVNYNERIQKDFEESVVNKVIELMSVVDIDNYKLTMFRCEKITDEIVDDFNIDVQNNHMVN